MLKQLFFLALLYPQFILAQSKQANCIKYIELYQTYQDLVDNKPKDLLCLSDPKNKYSTFYNKLVLKDGKQKRKYNNGSLWGYKEGSITYRYFDENKTLGTYGYHKVISQIKGFVVYMIKESGGYRMSSTNYYYYYSKDLKTPLKRLNIKNIEIDYPYPEFIREVRNLERLSDTDASSNLMINEIYKKFFK